VSLNYFEEEDFEQQKNFDANTFRRIVELARPHWKWVVGFLLAILTVSFLDSYFTYLNKRLVDEGIVAHNLNAVKSILITNGILTLVQAAGVFTFIYLVGVLGEMIRYDLRRKMFNHLQELSLSYFSRTPVGWIMSRVT
jgi:ATP-binding cassette subfamily B protein